MPTRSDHNVRDCQRALDRRHRHGTRQAYLADRCRCDRCARANRDAENRRRREMAYGRPARRVKADSARERLRELADTRIGINQVARLIGVPRSTLARIRWGEPSRGIKPSQRIARDTADRILTAQINEDSRAAGTLADPTERGAAFRP